MSKALIPLLVLVLSASAAGDAIADGVAHDGQAADAPVRHAANAAAKGISLQGLTPHAVPDAEALATAFQRALQRGDRDGVLALLSADVRISESGHTQSRSEYAAGHLGEDIAFLHAASVRLITMASARQGDAAVVGSESEIRTTRGARAKVLRSREWLSFRREDGNWKIIEVRWQSGP